MRRDIFQALADPGRRAILLLLAVQPMTPNALVEHFDSSRQMVSKNLQILVECDLLVAEKQGRENFYHLKPEKFAELEQYLQQFKNLLSKRFSQLDDVLDQMKLKNT